MKKTLRDLVNEAIKALGSNFSVYNVTQQVRQLTYLAQNNNEELDLPLSTEGKAHKYDVKHIDVKSIVENMYVSGVLDRRWNSLYYLYDVVAVPTPALTNTQSVTPPPAKSPVLPQVKTPATLSVGDLAKRAEGYLAKYQKKWGTNPTIKEFQSALRREVKGLKCADIEASLRVQGFNLGTNLVPVSQRNFW